MGCGATEAIRIEIADGGELFPRHGCGSSDWMALPTLSEPTSAEIVKTLADRRVATGELIETPYGHMTRDQFDAHARLMDSYWRHMRDAMRDFGE